MRVLIIDPGAQALGVAFHAQRNGHDVKYCLSPNPKGKPVGEGLVPIVEDWREHLNWADLIFNSDNTKYTRELHAAKEKHPGIKIMSPCPDIVEWELNRCVGMDVLKKHGIKCPDYKVFDDYDEAIRYVEKEQRRFVSKPTGDADKALSYVGKSSDDLSYMLRRWKQQKGNRPEPFILQEFIGGIEMAAGVWCGPHGFSTQVCENFEFKKLMAGNLGVNTGEMGTIVRYVNKSKLFDKVLKPLERAVKKHNYVGYLDVNCIIDDKGTPWPLEFTVRPGWPTYNIQTSLLKGDTIQWLSDLFDGVDNKPFYTNVIACGVLAAIPDFPYSHATQKEVCDIPIYGLTESLMECAHPCEMKTTMAPLTVSGKTVMAPVPATAGDYVLVMVGMGETVASAASKAYRRLDRLTIPNSPFWRIDIGKRLAKELPVLQSLGYATGMTYRA